MKNIQNSKTTVTTINSTIDYENGIFCDYIVKNDELTDYHFFTMINNTRLPLKFVSDINIYITSHWSTHSDLFRSEKSLTLANIESLDVFDNLYYIGAGMDGTIKDRYGKMISSLQRIDDSLASIYLKIQTNKKADRFIEAVKDIDWILDLKKVDIPHYNRDSYEKGTTVQFNVILPQDIFDTIYDGRDYCNADLIATYLKKTYLPKKEKV